MSKRRNENGQMRREDYEAEDDDRGSGVAADAFEKGFQRASEDKIRERKIVKARTGPLSRPAKPAASSSSTDAASGSANPFGGFQGLTAAPVAKANPFAGFGGLTADKPAPATTPAFDFGALPKAPAASAVAAAASTSASAKPASSYQEAIEVLNKDFLAFVAEQAKENPSVSWIAAVQEYVKYADEIAAKHASTKPVPIGQPASSKAVAAPAPAFSTSSSFGSSSNGSTSAFSSTSGFSFGTTAVAKDDKKKEEPPKLVTTTGFSFGGAKKDDATAPTATGSAFSFGAKPSDAKPAATTSTFSFGAKPDAPKDSSAAKPAATTGFSFGNLGGSSASTPSAATGGFSFGNLSSSSAAAPSVSTLKPFSFGGSSAAAAAPAAAADDDDDENVGREEATVILKSDSPDDDCVFDVEKAKVFEFKKDEKRWADKGLHPLKVLVNKDSKKARILVRNEIGKIVLNSSLYKGMSIKAHETKGKKTGVIVSLQVDGAMTQYLLKVNAAKVDEFTEALEKAAASSHPSTHKANAKIHRSSVRAPPQTAPSNSSSMVHFNLRLRDNMYAEWRHEYVDYKKLKRLLKKQQQIDASLTAAASTALLDVDTDASSASDDNYAAISTSKPDASASGSSRSTSSFLRSLAPNSHKAVDTSELQALVVAPAAFEDALKREYDKVESAYIRHVTHFADELALLKDQYRYDAPAATQESLKNSLVELHRLLNLLQNFALLNYTGFVKIMKKHDKMFPSLPSLRRDHKCRLQRFAFAETQQCRELLRELEQMFADLFCEGNRSVAIATLMTKKEDFVNWAHIYIGIKIGSCIILLVWVVWDSLVVPTFKSERERHIIDLAVTRAYPVYRGIGCLLLLHWLVGLSLYVWRLARINYRYIFELDPRNTQQYTEVFSDATNMTIVFLVNVLLYYKVVNGYFPEAILHRGYYPLLLLVYTFYFYIVRTWGKQRGMLRTLVEIVCSPFYPVTFFHTFVGDYLTSTVKVSQDLCWSLCFFATQEFLEKDVVPDARTRMSPLLHHVALDLGNSDDMQQGGCQNNVYYVNVAVPLICALPLWWRFLQSLRRIYDTETWWPNLPNAFKYALAQVVALFGIFHPFYSGDRDNVEAFQITWIVLFTLSSMYTWVWDVTMDWGLGRPQYNFLGDRQMFSRKWVYYLAIVADLFLRFAWTMTLIPPHSSRILPLYLLPFTMVGELFRRTFWSFFRLENEHLRNTQGFRRVDFIPLHYDHGVGDDDLDDAKDDLEPLNGRVFLMKILLIIFLVLGLSIVAIVVEK